MAIKFKDLAALIKRRTGKEDIGDILIAFNGEFEDCDPFYGTIEQELELAKESEKHFYSDFTNELTLKLK